MSNMDYCRFQNTLQDLKDCYEHMDETEETDERDGLSREEAKARTRLIGLCETIAAEYGEEAEGE
jgi:hypothetical protein